MTEKNASFNFIPWIIGTIAIVAILLIYKSTTKKETANEQSTEESAATAEVILEGDSQATNVETNTTNQVAFLNLSDEELDELPQELADYYREIVQTKNFASGISILKPSEKLNNILNDKLNAFELDAGTDEAKLREEMDGLKINPRVTGNHFHYCGRAFLKKIYVLQDSQYPKLSSQIRSIKSALGDVPAQGNLQGNGNKVKKFFDESFLFLYLIWEEENKPLTD